MQALFNGKENNTGKKASPKLKFSNSVKTLTKKNGATKVIQQVLSIEAKEKVDKDFVLCYSKGHLSYSTKPKLIRELVNGDNSLTELSTADAK